MTSPGIDDTGPAERPGGAVRRPVPRGPSAEEAGSRRGCMLVGGALGIIAGTLVALFVMPMVFNHYFGTSDIDPGDSYDRDGRIIRVLGAERVAVAGEEFPGVFEVTIEVRANSFWAPGSDDFELELSTGGPRVELLPPDATRPETSLAMPLAETRTVVLRFAGSERRDAEADTLHILDPRVRFHLLEAVHE